MSVFQGWCREILPYVQAGANGEKVEYKSQYTGNQWRSFEDPTAADCLSFDIGESYRIKPKTFKVNGFDVPEPLCVVEPCMSAKLFIAAPSEDGMYSTLIWLDTYLDRVILSRRLLHTTKEAAIAHAKAMLGVDPHIRTING